MTPEEFTKEMKAVAKFPPDVEAGHSSGDELLCKVLRELGYGEGVEIFENMDKWYA